MVPRKRLVLDSNLIISGVLFSTSVPGAVFRQAIHNAQILVSEATLDELADVLSREKFDPYITIADRQQLLQLLVRVAEIVPTSFTVRACRDPKDDKFLEVAVNGSADLIITGDQDLLALHSFHNIPIITPAQYLETEMLPS